MSSTPSAADQALLDVIGTQDFYNKNLGPFCAGLAVQMFMMGVLTLQTWNYFELFRNDSTWNKFFVTALFITGAIQTGTDFQLLYDAFVTGYGNIIYWNRFGWTFIYELGWSATIAALAQVFFLHRCYVITRSKIILAVGGLGILISFGAGWAASIGLIFAKFYTETDKILIEGTTWLISTAVTDLGISVILIYHLRKAKTGFQTTERMLSKIIRLAFETAALTSFIAICNLILYAGFGKINSVHLFFQFIVGKTYSHSVMVTLLARTKLASGMQDSNGVNVMGASGPDSTKPNGGITVTTTQLRVSDPHTAPFDYPMKTLNRSEDDDFEGEDDKSVTRSSKIARIV